MGKPIPKNATLQFDFHLIFIEKESTNQTNINQTNTNEASEKQQLESIERSLKYKTIGNEFYAAKEYDKAFIFYQKSLKGIPTTFGEGLFVYFCFMFVCLFCLNSFLFVFFFFFVLLNRWNFEKNEGN